MLFKQIDLKKIVAGEITLVFRCWKRPTVRKGTLINTSLGRLEISDINAIELEDIPTKEAKMAGFQSVDQLCEELSKRLPGTIYKIALSYHSPDPRIQLRQEVRISNNELNKIITSLQRLDRTAKSGPWTRRLMEAIQQHPRMRAATLAEFTGDEKEWLKLQVRKLKNKGLTISHGIGYSLSPRGSLVLNALTAND